MPKIINLAELYSLVSSSNKTFHFSATDGNKLSVAVGGTIKFEKDDKNAEGLTPVVLQACHTGENVNSSSISDEVMTAALPSFSNRPILGYIWTDENGDPQFYGHNMHEEDGDIVYDEVPVGVIPESCNARLEFDEDKGKTYVVVNGYIYDGYSKALDILEREGSCDVSVELEIREMSYSAQDKVLVIEDFYFAGVTILGMDEDGNKVYPGMEGSNIVLANFANNTDGANEIEKKLDQILNALSSINKNEGKEDNSLMKFKELLEKYGVTEEEIDFEIEGLSDEDLESAFAEKFETKSDPGAGNNEPEGEPEGEQFSYSVSRGQETKEFSITLSEQLAALSDLVNATYSDEDGTFYSVDADPDKKYVYMVGWNGKAYRQSYKVKKGVYTLINEREPVVSVWMTEEEKNQFDRMTASYSSMAEELKKHNEEPLKMEILSNKVYSSVTNTEEFVALTKDHFDMSVEEVSAKADAILLNAAKNGALEFASNKGEPKGKALPLSGSKTEKNDRYGGLFKSK